MNVDWARLCVLVALVCCVGLAVAAGSSIATSSTVPAANDSDPVVHLDPAEYDDDGDYDSLQAWFIDDLEDRLQRSSAAIAAGTIDDARVPLDETYVERVDQYETLVAETGAAGELDEADPLSEAQAGGPETPLETRSDDLEPADVVDAFEQTRVEQLALIEAVDSYDDTETAYEQAIDDGNEAGALEHARELDTLAADVDVATERLAEHRSVIDALAAVDGPALAESLADRPQSIQERQETIREAQFAPTTLTATADADSVGPTETVTITGTLETASEPAESWTEIDSLPLEINGESQSVAVDDGTFTVSYQPDPLSPTVDEIPVQYRPAPGIPHQKTETTVPVAVDAAPATLSLDADTDHGYQPSSLPDDDLESGVAYGERIGLSGTLTAKNRSVDGAPVTLTIGDTTLGTLETESGTLEGDIVLPASVPAGEHELIATVDGTDRAITSASATHDLTVRESETALYSEAVRTDDGDLAVAGTLTTLEGTPVPGQPVAVTLEGTPVGTIWTDAGGQFSETLSPGSVAVDQQVTVSYDGTNTNLNEIAVTTSVTDGQLPTLVAGVDGWPRLAVVLAGALAVLGAAGSGIWYSSSSVRRRFRSRFGVGRKSKSQFGSSAGAATHSTDEGHSGETSLAQSTLSSTVEAAEPDSGSGPAPTSSTKSDDLLEQADDRLSSGRTNEAVELAYAAVRLQLHTTVAGETAQSLTHWEFYERYTGPQTDDLELLTSLYERAAFGPATVTVETAEEALLTAQALLKLTDDKPVDLDALDGLVIET